MFAIDRRLRLMLERTPALGNALFAFAGDGRTQSNTLATFFSSGYLQRFCLKNFQNYRDAIGLWTVVYLELLEVFEYESSLNYLLSQKSFSA